MEVLSVGLLLVEKGPGVAVGGLDKVTPTVETRELKNSPTRFNNNQLNYQHINRKVNTVFAGV